LRILPLLSDIFQGFTCSIALLLGIIIIAIFGATGLLALLPAGLLFLIVILAFKQLKTSVETFVQRLQNMAFGSLISELLPIALGIFIVFGYYSFGFSDRKDLYTLTATKSFDNPLVVVLK
jgi:hypothetical protein